MNKTGQCLPVTCPEKSTTVLLHVLTAAVVLLTVCGNLLVIISVSHFKQLHTPTNVLIMSLASSDFLVGVFVMPVYFTKIFESCWILGLALCSLSKFAAFLLTSASVHNVALIAVDRCFAVSNPFLYSKKVSFNGMCIIVLANWVFLFHYNFSMLYISGNFEDTHMCPGECYVIMTDIYFLIDTLVVFVLPCPVIIILYSYVFVIVRRHAIAIRKTNQINAKGRKDVSITLRSERKAAKVLGILVSVFLLCLVPYYVCSLIPTHAANYMLKHFVILMYMNSALNPIIYALFYPSFRKGSKLILTLKIFQKDSSLILLQS